VVFGAYLTAMARAQSPKSPTVLRGHGGKVDSLRFRPDGEILVSGDRLGSVRVWSIRDAKELHARGIHKGRLSELVVSKDGKSLISAGEDGVKVWDLGTGAISGIAHDEARCVALAPDARSIAC